MRIRNLTPSSCGSCENDSHCRFSNRSTFHPDSVDGFQDELLPLAGRSYVRHILLNVLVILRLALTSLPCTEGNGLADIEI